MSGPWVVGQEKCWRCDGSGWVDEPMDNRGGVCTCEECGGTGHLGAHKSDDAEQEAKAARAALLRAVEGWTAGEVLALVERVRLARVVPVEGGP